MKKVIEKYFCDFCGEECEGTNFVFPEMSRTEAYDLISGKTLKAIDCVITKKEVDICPKCQEKIARLLEFIKYTEIDEHGNMTISFS